ncbi:DNA-binding transcriptional regulator, FadR family [Amycolatopsis arida]|uniref:DNA-binding transcriptional regulator, FadR family n=1 Tax=Amycolatopsis arida TaxID=587909 RepID=A0A1I5TX77_9PSEU|nr:GntR family transcriptional regulator [Amycolatopsis arida]TDX95927.1 DNA-binding FadR family transcriptional regulator [Amycolatopsis arida]SFP87619.1 DNA-binding transcriptional regulator, FadR family [Amycolatopsis arida]
MRFEPVAPVRAYERVVEQIEQAVLSGRLAPGARLPSERDLMAQFGVSRSTVREALRVLQAGAVIRSRAGDPRGPEVLPPSPATLEKSMRRLARAEHLGLAELLQFRMQLEGSAFLLAARLRTAEQLAEMEIALAAMRTHVDDDYTAFSEADVAFHEAVARATQNSLIVVCGQVVRGVVLELIEDKLAHADDRRALMRASLAHHTEVLRAVRDQDGPLACRLARRALYDYYAEYVPAERRAMLEPLLDQH